MSVEIQDLIKSTSIEHFAFFVLGRDCFNGDICGRLDILIGWVFEGVLAISDAQQCFGVDGILRPLEIIVKVRLKDFFISLERVNLLVERIYLTRTILLRSEFLKGLNSQIVNRRVDLFLRLLINDRSLQFVFLNGEDVIISVESTQFIELRCGHLVILVSWKNRNVQTKLTFDWLINTICVQNLSHLLRCQDILFNDVLLNVLVHLLKISIHFIRTQKNIFTRANFIIDNSFKAIIYLMT